MILVSLTTQCFKKLGDYSVNFTDGLNVISGDNAHGKSTLLQAVGFALYGNEAVSGVEADIRTWGETRAYSAELTFSEGGHTYVATRSKSTAKVTRDGELVANGKSECTKFITTLLTLNWKDFKTFVLSKQFDTFAILEEGATTLNRKVEERSGITLIDKVQSLSRGKARELELEAAKLEHAASSIEEQVAEAAEFQQKVDDLSAALTELKEAEPKAPTSVAPDAPAPEERPTYLTEKQNARIRAEESVANATIALARAQETLAQVTVESVEDAVEVLGGTEERIAEAEERLETVVMPQLQKSSDQLRTQAIAQNTLADLEASIMALYTTAGDSAAQATAIASANEKVSSVRAQLKEANEQKWNTDSQIKAISAALSGGVCPTCNRAYDDHADLDVAAERARLEELKVESLNLTQTLCDLNKELDSTQLDVRHLQAQLEQFEKLQEDHTKVSGELAKVEVDEARVEALRTEADTLRTALHDYEKDKLRAESALANATKQESLKKHCLSNVTTAQAALDEAQAALDSSVVVMDEQIAEATARWTDWQQAVSDIELQQKNYLSAAATWRVDVAETETNLRHARSDLSVWTKRVEQLREQVAEWERLTKKADACKRLATFLAERRASYLRDVWNQIMAVASAYINVATDGLITAVSYEDGTFFYEENELKPSVASASGAQLAFIGISIRIGLSRVLYGDNSLLIFDEPTESMSEANAASVVGALATSAKQVVVITHKTSDQELAKNVIEL